LEDPEVPFRKAHSAGVEKEDQRVDVVSDAWTLMRAHVWPCTLCVNVLSGKAIAPAQCQGPEGAVDAHHCVIAPA
jgi:hypothetical protein